MEAPFVSALPGPWRCFSCSSGGAAANGGFQWLCAGARNFKIAFPRHFDTIALNRRFGYLSEGAWALQWLHPVTSPARWDGAWKPFQNLCLYCCLKQHEKHKCFVLHVFPEIVCVCVAHFTWYNLRKLQKTLAWMLQPIVENARKLGYHAGSLHIFFSLSLSLAIYIYIHWMADAMPPTPCVKVRNVC